MLVAEDQPLVVDGVVERLRRAHVRAAFGVIPPPQFDPREVKLDITYEYATDTSVWRRYGSRRADITVRAFGPIDQ